MTVQQIVVSFYLAGSICFVIGSLLSLLSSK